MSLNGLDADKVTAAHEAVIAEPAGWFLLNYTSRDEVDLLGHGTEGFVEAREAIAKYEEESPLFGLVVYKKKKALLKYVPEGTSRLLQARLAVHLQSVIEKFPHEALLTLTTAAELTESDLNASLFQLKSSASVRSTASPRKQRPLTEIPEDSDETSQKQSPAEAAETAKEQKQDLGPESPPDPLLSPAAQPSSPARLESNPEALTPGSDTAATPELTISERAARSSDEHVGAGEPKVSLDRLERPALLTRAATYEADVSWAYKPKVKLGPRPSLDHDVQPRASGTFQRPVASLPAGIRVSAKRSPEVVRPHTQSSSKSFHSEMPRYASFSSPLDRPTSRGSAASVPAYMTQPLPISPISPTAPAITPEKQRLLKALEQRKKQQAKKAAAEATRKAAEGAEASNEEGETEQNNTQEAAEIVKTEQNGDEHAESEKPSAANITEEHVAERGHSQQTPDIPGNLVKIEQTASMNQYDVAGASIKNESALDEPASDSDRLAEGLVTGDEAIARDRSTEDHPVALSKALEGTTKEPPVQENSAVDNEEQKKDTAESEADSYVTDDKHAHTRNNHSIQEGTYLAHSESSTSVSEISDNWHVVSPAADVAHAAEGVSKEASESHLPHEAGDGENQEPPAGPLPIEGSNDRESTDPTVPSAFQAPVSNAEEPLLSKPIAQSAEPPVAEDGPQTQDRGILIGTEAVDFAAQETPLTVDSVATAVVTEPNSESTNVEYADQNVEETSVDRPIDGAESASTSNHAHHRATDSVSTVKAGDALVAAHGSHHRPTDSSSTVRGPRADTQDQSISPTDQSGAAEDPEIFDTSDLLLLRDPKRSSAASKTSQNSAKKRPPPLASSKHDSSDLTSLDDDLFYEELRSATVEQARPMVVSRSPATPVFQDAPRPGSRRSSELTTLSRAVASPLGNEVPQSKQAQTMTAPSPLTSFDPEVSPTDPAADALGITKIRSLTEPLSPPSPAAANNGNGNTSPRKSSGVSSLISQRIKAFEKARANEAASPTDRTAMIAPSIVSQRKASLTTPPGSAGADSLNGSRSGNRPYPTPSPSPNGFVARTFGSVRVSSNHTAQRPNGSLHRQSSRESAGGADRSNASSRFSSVNTSPSEVQKPMMSYFSVSAPATAKERTSSAEPMEKYARRPSVASIGKSRRLSVTSTATSTSRDPPAVSSRASFSSRRSTASQASNDTARPMSSGSPRSESSFSSDKSDTSETKRGSRGSRLLHRMSSALSPRRNIAQALSPPLSDQAIEESQEPVTRNKWTTQEIGDVNIQFPDNLLWKRRYLAVDAGGNLILSPATSDKGSKIKPKTYHVAQFRAPYVPDQDREEMPHSIMLDFQDGSTLQCSCTDGASQTRVLQVLRNAHAAFTGV